MAPSSKPPRPSRDTLQPTRPGPQRLASAENCETQQAGRSATSLNAQASAQSLREASRPSKQEKENAHSTAGRQKPPPTKLQKPAPAAAQAYVSISSPYTPAFPSPLNPAPSETSSASRSRNASGASEKTINTAPSPPRNRLLEVAEDAAAAGRKMSAARSMLDLPTLTPMESTTSLRRLSTPRSVRDLGSDYTRYFNPFTTESSSPPELPTTNTPPPPSAKGQSVSPEGLAKRLSNPFKDPRPRSSFYDPPQNNVVLTMTPPTPRHRHGNNIPTERTIAPPSPPSPPSPVGTPAFIREADPEKAPFFTYMDDRFGAPCEFPLYMDQQEEDDEMHMPRWDDDKRYRLKFKDRLSREQLVNTVGVAFLITGILTLFVALPIISFLGKSLIPYMYETPLNEMPGHGAKEQPWAKVNDNLYPLLQNIRTGLVDPDTPSSAVTRKSIDGKTMELVFSDEFNEKNRTFYPGDDPYWTAPDIWYAGTQDLEWYDPDAVNTGDGTLQLQMDWFQNHGLNYRSGMLNSWNQVCFKGGVFEVSVSLPGPAGVHGLWPGVWTMGNLGRPGYMATTDGVWPYTYDTCDTGITPNQSMTDGTSFLPGQRLSTCTCSGEDHPTPGTGRGAPEIDIIEVSADWGGKGIGVATQSYQVAPFDVFWYPNYDFMETPNYQYSFVNTYTGGPMQQAVSTTTMLNNAWYDGKQYQKYSFEYTPGTGEDAGIAWFVGDDEMMAIDGRAIGPNGNIQDRLVSEEPMSIILNLGISNGWTWIENDKLKFPAVMRVDYVRWYQPEGSEMVTCDPPGYETTEYIANHPEAYLNPNLTTWGATGYTWPKNALMHDCEV
ncbi:unnamed protein product [Zymoseptoria tritici ST99CH_1E4]|uniref:GH16 domain-containing protein n=1 Tax=Zymoseptoria tritici ST99CH_1E4 TaxID=1276532 RepID=A0A2H1H025_ZYMTR|nr:unnamed protein product [Zymoseptoria tritici ST99CH_1E4]